MTRKYNLPKHVCYDKASSKAAGRDWYDTSISYNGKQLKTKSCHTVQEAMFEVAQAAQKVGKWTMQEAGEYIASYTPDMGKEVINETKTVEFKVVGNEDLINQLTKFLKAQGCEIITKTI